MLRRPGRARRAAHLDHRDRHHGLFRRHARIPLLISVKAVDPARLSVLRRGEAGSAAAARARRSTRRSVVVSDDLLLRLKVRTGDTLHIGGQDFRIAGVVTSEPDRMTGSLNVGPRVMITREGLDRTGLISLGSRAAERYLFRLPATGAPGVGEVRAILKTDVSRSHHRRLPRDAPHHHARAGPLHHVPQPDRPDRAGDRRHGRGQRHARPPAAEAGFHRGDEVHGRALGAGDPHLHGADADAGPGRRRAGRGLRHRGGGGVSGPDRQVFHHRRVGVMGRLAGACRASRSPAW